MLKLSNVHQFVPVKDKRYQLYQHELDKSYLLMKVSSALIAKLQRLLLGKLIIINGTSCSGKSSVAKALANRNSTIVHLDADAIIRRVCLQLIQEIYPELFSKLYHILGENLAYYALYYSQDDAFSKRNILKSGIIKEAEIQSIQQIFLQNHKALSRLTGNITHALLEQIRRNIYLGKTVLLDIVVDEQGLKPFIEFTPRVITIYRPLALLSEFIYARNKQAVEENAPINFRRPDIVYSQLGTFFSSKIANSTTPTLETLTYDYLAKIITQSLISTNELGFSMPSQVGDLIKKVAKCLHLLVDKNNPVGLKGQADLLIAAQTMKNHELGKLIKNYLDHEPQYKKLRKELGYALVNSLNTQPRLIILDGLSTAGKTTTAKAFMKLNPISILLYRSERQRELLQARLPVALKRNNNYGPSIFCYANYRNHAFFQSHFHGAKRLKSSYLNDIALFAQEKQGELLQAEEKNAAEKAAKYLAAGITVILDNLIFKHDLSHFEQLSPLVVLIYCPFADIIRHIQTRDEEAITHDKPLKWRDPYKVYDSYTRLFGAANKLNAKASLETLSKQTVLEVLDKLFQHFPPAMFGVDQETFKTNILERLGLALCDSVEIYPQLTLPDFVLNTGNCADDNAARLSSYLNDSEPTLRLTF